MDTTIQTRNIGLKNTYKKLEVTIARQVLSYNQSSEIDYYTLCEWNYFVQKSMEMITCNNKDLFTDCEVYTGKYCLRFFVQTEQRRSEVCAIKTEGNTFRYRPSKRG
jgi:hypothetical protein